MLENLRIVDSKGNVLIQLADIVADTLRRFAEQEKHDAVRYRQTIEKRIEDICTSDALLTSLLLHRIDPPLKIFR